MNAKPLSALPLAAYVHIPFCVSKCVYCDFNSYEGLEYLFDDYARAVLREIEQTAYRAEPDGYGVQAETSLSSVYFGGGTPTLLPVGLLGAILQKLAVCFGVESNAEVTVEANPESVDARKLEQLRSMGFNRISLGVQSFDDAMLLRLGRVHRLEQALRAYREARSAGFDSVSIDLMFALPDQSLDHWRSELEMALVLRPEHVSVYELTIEPGTRLESLHKNGEVVLPDEETRLKMYETAIIELSLAGYEHYEVSNFALPGFRCRHNQVYWRNEPFYGFGAGATNYLGGVRSRRLSDPREYVKAVFSDDDLSDYSEKLTGRALLGETIILSLRMLDGVSFERLKTSTGLDPRTEFGDEIACLLHRGLVEITNDTLRLTHRGLLLLNDVSEMFVQP
ncbi:MAG: radical SAM family heme chaperone HemW [Armatimonadota bacterium]